MVSVESEDDTESVFDADCCNGIVAVVVAPFCGERIGGGDGDDKVDAEGRVAVRGAGAFCVSGGADCVSNSGGVTCAENLNQLANSFRNHVMRRALGVACTLVMSLARSQ